MTESTTLRLIVRTVVFGFAGVVGCSSPTPPPNLPPPEYEPARTLEIPKPAPTDEDRLPAATDPAPLARSEPVPIEASDLDAGRVVEAGAPGAPVE